MKMTCPHCNSSLQIPENHEGSKAKCPKCKNTITISGVADENINGSLPLSGETKPCPSCGQLIMTSAIKCKYCKSYISDKQQSVSSSKPPRPNISHGIIPTKFRLYLSQNETIYYASNPSTGALVLGMIVTGLPLLLIAASMFIAEMPLEGLVSIITLLIALLVRFLSWKHRYYIITDRRTFISEGIFNIAISIIPNRNIQMICVNTGFIDRILGLNTIEVSSSAQGGGNIFSFFTGKAKGCISLRWVEKVSFILQCYEF